MSMLKFSHTKIVRLFKELDEIGLIERKKQGQGLPTLIYVKNFTSQEGGRTPHTDDFLESIYMAGADLSGTQVERHARTISRSNEMLKLVNRAVEVLRTKHKYGEKYYWVLFYTFLSPQQYESADELVAQLKPHIHDISRPTYFRIRRKAVDAVSPILWGYSSRECISILDEFFPEGSQT